MSKYHGTFSVLNITGKTIYNVKVSHSTSDHLAGSINVKELKNDERTGKVGKVETSSGNRDHWKVSYIIDGVTVEGSHACGFESEDNGGNVIVSLHLNYFKILNPKSSDCTSDYN